MNPIPLAAPDGTVYTYACGECHHPASGCSLLVNAKPGELADWSLREASRCCSCFRCGSGPVESLHCDACEKEIERLNAAREERERPEMERRAKLYETSIAQALDRDVAEMLKDIMSDVSEDYYCASWLIGLEFDLWRMLEGGDRRFGAGTVSEDEVEELRRLHEKADGWWHWDEGADCKLFVTADQWKAIYAKRKGMTPTPSPGAP